MGVIHELSPSLVNQIAAGEVVERPASVVKELLENAIDAGATRVEISAERGGKDLLRIADNGTGIAREDLLLAFQPHATSKVLEADDLFRIRTLGFRGEALAAIAEVSRVRCQTRTEADAEGSEIVIDGGVASPIRDCASPVGTVMEVRNLFFNTPVRRSFLKADSTEAGHVADTIARVALAHPTVQFVYRSGGRILYDLPATSGLKDRVAAFFGQELADSLLWVESRSGEIHVRGYVAHPSQSRSTTKGQHLFVGGRYVRDRSLGHALSEAYRGLLMVGRYPVAFLYLDLPPEEVDVNVHPTKIEVRFRDGHQVYSQLLSTIRQTFLASDLHSRLQVPAGRQEPAAASGGGPSGTAPSTLERAPYALHGTEERRQEVASWFQPGDPVSPTGATGRFEPAPLPADFGHRPEPGWAGSLPPRTPSSGSRSFDEFGSTIRRSPEASGPSATAGPDSHVGPTATPTPARPPVSKALQLHDSYLIAETDEGMVVIDQHALHERILYEELRQRVEAGGVEAQRLLVPEPVELSAGEAAELLERREVLARLGLGIEAFGGGTVLVTSVPVMLKNLAPAELLHDLADHFRGSEIPPGPDALLNDVLSMVACKAAVKAGQPLSREEIAALLERRDLVLNTHHCPHGRPTALTFTRAELERQFGRI